MRASRTPTHRAVCCLDNCKSSDDQEIIVVLFCRYFMLGGAVVILGLGLPSRPDTSIMTWAKRQAKKELDEAA